MVPPQTIKTCLALIHRKLQPRLEAELLIAHTLQKPRSYLYAHPEQSLSENQQQQIDSLVNKRLQGEPIAYLLGEKEFWSLGLQVNQHTLIPRPETELLVTLLLEKLPTSKKLTIADLGTGCGAVALALASACPNWQIVATDQSLPALQVAQHNAQRLGLDQQVSFLQGNWCEALPKTPFAAIVSNPPYIAENDPHLTQGDLRFEPKTALISGQDGLDAIRLIITQAVNYLSTSGWLLLEHGFNQGPIVRQLLHQAGYQQVASHPDLSGIERVSSGCRAQIEVSNTH